MRFYPSHRCTFLMVAALPAVILMAAGCQSPRPGPTGADLSLIGLHPEVAASIHGDNRAQIGVEPKARFPLRLAVAELIAAECGDRSRYRVTQPAAPKRLEPLAELQAVADVRIIDRRMVPRPQDDGEPLRRAAELLGADMLLAYTIHLDVTSDDKLPVLTLLTLGLAPTVTERGNAVIDAVLIDSHSGYIYGVARTEASNTRLATPWSSRKAARRAIARARERAVTHLIDRMPGAWSAVPDEYAYAR